MTSQLVRDFQRLKSENQQLRSENQRLRAENQAAKEREERYRNERKKEDRDRRDRERLERLMLRVHGNQIAFPQEIMDQFIDHLYDDRRTLKKCALVCRAWVPSSRYHLFSVINILHDSDYQRFDDLIQHLDHPLCTFASSSLFAHEIIKWSMISSWQALLKSASFTTQITHLILSNPSFESFERCMETIHSFPSLVVLEYNVENPDDDEWALNLPTFRGSPPPPLRTLDIVSWDSTVQLAWSQLMWKWLHRSQTRLSTIRLGAVISTDDISTSKLYPFAQYLQFLGPSLEVLKVCFNDAPSISLFLDNVDIALNTSLRMLDLAGIFEFLAEAQSFDGKFSLLPLLLSRIPKAALATIKFEFGIYGPNFKLMAEVTNTNATWIAIDKLLAGSSFPVLTEVAFMVYRHHCEFEIEKYLELRLARCKQRGLLHISIDQ
ncbi:hypothetical protein BDZ97DRAFT_1412821 [Flammula alnicola]|nr:hypothetical protein BDZ97DRAFT_1412821 [Flammula alnicola]